MLVFRKLVKGLYATKIGEGGVIPVGFLINKPTSFNLWGIPLAVFLSKYNTNLTEVRLTFCILVNGILAKSRFAAVRMLDWTGLRASTKSSLPRDPYCAAVKGALSL